MLLENGIRIIHPPLLPDLAITLLETDVWIDFDWIHKLSGNLLPHIIMLT